MVDFARTVRSFRRRAAAGAGAGLLGLALGGGGGCASEAEGAGDAGARDDLGADVAAAAALGTNCVVSQTVGGFKTVAHFTNPYQPCVPTSQAAGRDLNIENELRRLIDSVPAGSYIRGNIYSAGDQDETVVNALVRAEKRGVDVQISADDQIRSEPGHDGKDELESLTNMRFCPADTGCIANVSGGHAHTKMFTFSRTKQPGATAETTHVTWFGSYNLSNTASGNEGFNHGITIYGDVKLYDQSRDYLNDMYDRSPRTDDYYDAPGRGRLASTSAIIHASPQKQTDFVVDRLKEFTPDGQCQVRVANPWFKNNRSEVTDQLCAMRKQGCRVYVLTGTAHVDKARFRALKGCGIEVRVPLDAGKHDLLHDKLITVRGKTPAGYRHRVFGGSHNFADDSLRENDDLFVQLADDTAPGAPFYNGFVSHYGNAWGRATTLTEGML